MDPPPASTLHSLASHFNELDVSLLRLRLRFGVSRVLQPDVPFEIDVDLVDETAQSPRDLWSASDALKLSVEFFRDVPGLTLQQRVTRSSQPLRWKIRCVVTTSETLSSPTQHRLRVSCRSNCEQSGDVTLTPSHTALQSFCAGSQWHWIRVSHAALILPVVSSETCVATAPEPIEISETANSRCLRTFALPGSAVYERIYHISPVIDVEEDYGHAMGSHIWDASIWLSFALVAGGFLPVQARQRVLEIGSGCGLFACVLALTTTQDASIVLTEKPDALQLLEDNLCRNQVKECKIVHVDVHKLLWGEPSSDVRGTFDLVFASDVLYHWASHEALLASLDELCSASAHVLIAHKHRSESTSERLESVVATCVDAKCTSSADGCAWSKWNVQRLVRLTSTIDLLLLTRR